MVHQSPTRGTAPWRVPRSDPRGAAAGERRPGTRCRGTFGLRRRREVPSVALHGSGGRGRAPAEGRQHSTACRRRGRHLEVCSTIRTRAGSTPTLVKRTWCRSTAPPGTLAAAPIPPRRFQQRVVGASLTTVAATDAPAAPRLAATRLLLTTRGGDGRAQRWRRACCSSAARPAAASSSARGCKRGAGCWFLHWTRPPSLALYSPSQSQSRLPRAGPPYHMA